MHILLVVQLFDTPEDNGSDRLHFFASRLVQGGNTVKIVTANHDYKNARKRFEGSGKIYRQLSGLDIVYVPVYSEVRGSFARRFLHFISFFFACASEVFRSVKGADVIWAVSTPLTVPFLCSLVSKVSGTPLVSEISDVWPDAAVHSGVVKNKAVISLAEKVETFCYGASKALICLTEGIESNILRKGVDPEKTYLVTNGIDLSLFGRSTVGSRSEVRNRLGIDHLFVVMYMGAQGKYNALDTVIAAARELQDQSHINFVLVGDGERNEDLRKLVHEYQLHNVVFVPPVRRLDAPAMLSAADCFVLPNLAGEFFDGNLPNKVFDYLASERPVIVSGQVESARLVERASAGIVVDAEEPTQLAHSIKKLSTLNPLERDRIGKNGGDFVRQFYDRDSHYEIVLDVLETAVGQSRR